jgi:DEAD/DEAH box helicase domain-containing protein
MKQLIFDVETQKTFDEVGGFYPEKLGISFVGAIERNGFPEEVGVNEQYHRFFEKDLENFWPLLESADVVIGFNSNGFDLATLQPYYQGNISLLPSLDLLEAVKAGVGHRLSLDAIAAQTLGTKKSGSGLDAITYYRDKQWSKLAKYCIKDVEITRDLYDYGRRHKKIKYLDRHGNLSEAVIDFTYTPQVRPAGTQMALI